MDDIIDKIENSENFYSDSFLNFDFQLAEFNYLTLKPFFKGKVALELGPAIGQMTRWLVNDFDQLHIVEGSKKLLDLIPEYDNITKFHTLFENFTPPIAYDTIIMSHVLEHIKQPIELCSKIYNWLKKDGIFLVSVPNAKSIHRLVGKEMGLLKDEYELNERDHDLGHYRVYDLDLLKKHLKAAGFKIVQAGGVFFKPVSNSQIEQNWSAEMIKGFYRIGKYFPENCAEIYVICSK